MRRYLLLFLILFHFLNSKGATCIATSSGNWETAGTWSCGHMPTCGDSVYIPAGKTVTITSNGNYGCLGAMQVVVAGTLAFQTGKKVDFPCGTYFGVLAGGTLDPGTGNGNSNELSICSTVYWDAGDGTKTGPFCFNCNALPIQLESFNAACNNNDVNITWTTATETNNKTFDLERSDDGYNWAIIEEVAGAGTSSVAHNYSYIDESPLPGTSYYRLKQTDLDGNQTFPGLTTSNCTNETGIITIYPNPSSGNVYCKITSKSVQPMSISIVSELGQIITTYTDIAEEGVSVKQLPTIGLRPGVYLLLMTFPNSTIRKPFVISN